MLVDAAITLFGAIQRGQYYDQHSEIHWQQSDRFRIAYIQPEPAYFAVFGFSQCPSKPGDLVAIPDKLVSQGLADFAATDN